MSQVELGTSIGYALKRTTWALRGAMDSKLRQLGLGVPQYACLELLHQRPGISNAELARGVFSSRQGTHQLLAGLREAGLVESRGEGRGLRLALTEHGSHVLAAASRAVADVEEQMTAALAPADRTTLHRLLEACANQLRDPPG